MKVESIRKARAQMIVRHPFYANVLLSTDHIEEEPPPFEGEAVPKELEQGGFWTPAFYPTPHAGMTACTTGKEIYYNNAFMRTLHFDVVVFVLVHEVMHIVLMHFLRRGSRNPDEWNIACDFAINWQLKQAGFVVWEHALCDPQYAGMSAEQIYDIRKRKMEEAREKFKRKLKKALKDSAGGKGQGKGKGQGQGEGGDGEGGSGGDDSDEPMGPVDMGNGTKPKPGKRGEGTLDYGQHKVTMGDLVEIANSDPDLRRQIEREIHRKVAQAATMAKLQGKLPGDLERLIDGIVNPPQTWQALLRNYMTAKAKDDESWMHRSRRFSNIYLPGRYSEAMGEIVIIGDTSGSVTDQELAQIAAEVREMAELLKPERIRVIWADTRVAGEDVFEPGEEILLKPKGGGGTNMCVPMKHVEQYDPVVVLMFTDCATPWPTEAPPYPFLVLSSTKARCPWGDTIHLRPEDA